MFGRVCIALLVIAAVVASELESREVGIVGAPLSSQLLWDRSDLEPPVSEQGSLLEAVAQNGPCAFCWHGVDWENTSFMVVGQDTVETYWAWFGVGGGPCLAPGDEDCYPCENLVIPEWDCLNGTEFPVSGYYTAEAIETVVDSACAFFPVCTDEGRNVVQWELLESALAGGDYYRLTRLMEESEGMVFMNRERRALQGLGCGGRVSRHIPLDIASYLALNEALALPER